MLQGFNIAALLWYLVIPFGLYMMKTYSDWKTVLEEKVNKSITEDRLRIIMEDKLSPIREDIHDIRVQLNKLIDIFLRPGKPNDNY